MQFQGRKLQRWRRARTTALNDFVVKDLKEAAIGTKGRYSPTRSADPQPVGLVFQKPLANHVRITSSVFLEKALVICIMSAVCIKGLFYGRYIKCSELSVL